MNQERPTPETDAATLTEPYRMRELGFEVTHVEFARKLERERNEAREELADYKSAVERTNKLISDTVEKAIRERDEARELARELRDVLDRALKVIGGPADSPDLLWVTDDEYNATHTQGAVALNKAKEVLP